MPPELKPAMDDEEFKGLSGAFCSFIVIARYDCCTREKFLITHGFTFETIKDNGEKKMYFQRNKSDASST